MVDENKERLKRMIALAQETANATGFSFEDLIVEVMPGLAQKAREAGQQDVQKRLVEYQAALLDMWTQCAYARPNGGYHDGGLSALEGCSELLERDGLIDEQGFLTEQGRVVG